MIIKNKNNSGDWKELYPKTLASNVELNDGRSVEDLNTEVNSIVPSLTPLWEGNLMPVSGQQASPNKKLSDCSNGWILRWQRNTSSGLQDNNFHYSIIPKIHALLKNGYAVRCVTGSTGGTTVHKYVYVYGDRVSGHDTNGESPNNQIVLTGIFEW